VARTPASVGLPFEAVGFAATETGEPRLRGWWIPAAAGAPYRRYTVLYLHGQDGNLGDTVQEVAALHGAGVNVLAFDYRGYGQSKFAHPSEARWREDAEWALRYLTGTRHIDAGAIILDGNNLGANLALEIGAAHPELAGLVLELPLETPVAAIFNDPRARLVPAHLLDRDRFDATAAVAALRLPSLWFLSLPSPSNSTAIPSVPTAYRKLTSRKTLVWLATTGAGARQKDFSGSLARWLDDLHP
jgi:pimeloyl-ACP methyl ester carboxylesterase